MIGLFGTIAVISAILVITEKNTIHAVFYLVMSFVNSSVILIIAGVDYIGLLVLIVYVGAIAILFLFVVMMINIKSEDISQAKYIPIGLITTAVLTLEVYNLFPKFSESSAISKYEISATTNLKALGAIMYNWPVIMISSLVLLVAMIGAIVLTLSHSSEVKRQDLFSKWAQ